MTFLSLHQLPLFDVASNFLSLYNLREHFSVYIEGKKKPPGRVEGLSAHWRMPLKEFPPISSVSYPLNPQEPIPPLVGGGGWGDFASSRRSGSSKNSHFVSHVFSHPLTLGESAQADFLCEVALSALQTYIMLCFIGCRVLQALGPLGCQDECV